MLVMYVHTHWFYNHPYAARTWTVEDWRGYLSGLSKLGYDGVMIWPQLDCMPIAPAESDRAWLGRLREVIDFARNELGMKVLVVVCPNTIGNEVAADYEFAARPYFLCEKKVNPADPAEMAAFIAGRRNQLEPISNADGVVIIDSDPGGYPGATTEQFVDLLAAQTQVFRGFNPDAELVYWMWSGWEATCRFWSATADDPAAEHPAQTAAEFARTLEMIRQRVPEPWWVLASFDSHHAALGITGLGDKALWNPYGLIEGEPSFPMTNVHVDKLAQKLTAENLARRPRGVIGNSQTHCLQLPLTFVFGELARGVPVADIDLRSFAERLLPGLGETIAAAWELVESTDAAPQRAAAKDVQDAVWSIGEVGDLGGLLFGSPERFMTDLAMNLEVRAATNDLVHAEHVAEADSAGHVTAALRDMLDVLVPYQQRVGFTDACHGPLYDALSEVLSKLDDDGLNAALARWHNWADIPCRNGALTALLDAVEEFVARA